MKRSCTLPASANMFGDPCPGTLKYLEAHYQCMPGSDESINGSKVTLIFEWFWFRFISLMIA
jgi:hypothetical protein